MEPWLAPPLLEASPVCSQLVLCLSSLLISSSPCCPIAVIPGQWWLGRGALQRVFTLGLFKPTPPLSAMTSLARAVWEERDQVCLMLTEAGVKEGPLAGACALWKGTFEDKLRTQGDTWAASAFSPSHVPRACRPTAPRRGLKSGKEQGRRGGSHGVCLGWSPTGRPHFLFPWLLPLNSWLHSRLRLDS